MASSTLLTRYSGNSMNDQILKRAFEEIADIKKDILKLNQEYQLIKGTLSNINKILQENIDAEKNPEFALIKVCISDKIKEITNQIKEKNQDLNNNTQKRLKNISQDLKTIKVQESKVVDKKVKNITQDLKTIKVQESKVVDKKVKNITQDLKTNKVQESKVVKKKILPPEEKLKSLYNACKQNNFKGVKYWIEAAPMQMNNRFGKLNSSLLHMKTSNKITQYLIDKGLNVNSLDKIGRTPLHSAASSGEILKAELLIKNNAKLNVLCNRKWTPLCYAAHAGNEKTCKLLVDNGALIHDLNNPFPLPYQLAYLNKHYALGNYLIKLK